MITVTFNYDPDTNIVSNVTATGGTAAKAVVPPTKAKPKNKSTKITLNGSSLQLTQEACDLLKIAVGDRLCVRFAPGPVLVRPEIAKEPRGGNLITKSLTVSVKGKTGDELAKYGTEFEYNLKSDGYLILGDATTVADDQEDKPVEEINDEDFLQSVEGEEVDFTFDI